MSTTSRVPAATRARTCATALATGTERELPRPNGMTQKVQRWSQPFCTGRKARVRARIGTASGRGSAPGAITSSIRTRSGAGSAQIPASSLRRLPRISATSGIAA